MYVGPSTILPPTACQARLSLDGPVPPEVTGIPLPPGLERAVPKRQLQFRAGRYCAMKALEALSPRFKTCRIDRADNGAPIWPGGAVGSITHTDDLASAAVALTTDADALGVDSERIVSGDRAREIGALVASPDEVARACASGMSEPEAFTLVFSAKEAIFKCLHPMTGEFMNFHDVRIDAVDMQRRIFSARLMRTLSARFPVHTMLQGCFEIDAPWVHTGIALPASHGAGHGDLVRADTKDHTLA